MVEVIKNKVEREIIKLVADGVFLKHIFKIQNTVADETVLVFNKDNIEMLNVDPTYVCMVRQVIPIRNIEEYKKVNIDQNIPIKIGVSIDKMVHITKTINKNDTLKLEYDSNIDTTMLNIKMGFFDQKIGLYDKAGIPIPKIPNLNLPARFTIGTKIFYDFLVQANRVSNYISIKTDKEKLTLTAEGDTDKVNVEISKNMLLEFESYNNYQSLFSIDYLKNIFNVIKTMFTHVTIKIGNDVPLMLIASDKSELMVLLASRIEGD